MGPGGRTSAPPGEAGFSQPCVGGEGGRPGRPFRGARGPGCPLPPWFHRVNTRTSSARSRGLHYSDLGGGSQLRTDDRTDRLLLTDRVPRMS